MYGIFGREITKYTAIYGVYIRFWPTLGVTHSPQRQFNTLLHNVCMTSQWLQDFTMAAWLHEWCRCQDTTQPKPHPTPSARLHEWCWCQDTTQLKPHPTPPARLHEWCRCQEQHNRDDTPPAWLHEWCRCQVRLLGHLLALELVCQGVGGSAASTVPWGQLCSVGGCWWLGTCVCVCQCVFVCVCVSVGGC